jgi:hypothetical protein
MNRLFLLLFFCGIGSFSLIAMDKDDRPSPLEIKRVLGELQKEENIMVPLDDEKKVLQDILRLLLPTPQCLEHLYTREEWREIRKEHIKALLKSWVYGQQRK